MKTIPLVFVAVMAITASVRSQDVPIAESPESVATPTAARIIGTIPDGTPPPPAPPKPEFIVPAKEILSTATHEQGGRTITIHEIKPIDLPPPPAPPSVSKISTSDEAAFRTRLAQYRASHPKSVMVCLGATVYRSKNSPPRTLLRYWPGSDGEPITLWSSADFALISGIHSFVGTDGHTRSLFMMWSSIDLDRLAIRFGSSPRSFQAPSIPEFPAGNATYQFVGTTPAADDLVPIQSLHDLYNREFLRLKTAYEGREQARIEREAFLKAHPPQPKDITLNYWRAEKPAAAKKGGTQ
jgi:hypothetical protein